MPQKPVYDENKPTEAVMKDLANMKQREDYRKYFKDTDIATMKDLLNDIQSTYIAPYQTIILKDLIAEQINAIASDEGTTIMNDIHYGITLYIVRIILYNHNGTTVDIGNPVKVDLTTVHKIENNLGYTQTKLIKYEKPIVGRHYTDPYLTLKFRYQDTTITLCPIDYNTAGDYTKVLAYNINDTGWSKVSTRCAFGKSGG